MKKIKYDPFSEQDILQIAIGYIDKSKLRLQIKVWRVLQAELLAILADFQQNVREKSQGNHNKARFGAKVKCGCWYYIAPGVSVGKPIECPIHGITTIEQCNVVEPPTRSSWVQNCLWPS